ncbi:uncharacterized protein [Amphiura filiformis]|uniref:uncharacterized protein isoform X1 n=1 Tax=Amphiura filiformis TaxID=82378 RepID=UPI003B21DD30
MMANRVQNGTSVQGPQAQPHVGFFRKMRRSLTRRGTRRSRSESPTPTGRNHVCVASQSRDSERERGRSYVGHTVSRSRDLTVAKKNCHATAVPFRPRIAPLVKTEDLEPEMPSLLYARAHRNGIGHKDICDEIPIPQLVKGDPQLRHCVDMDENANRASEKKLSPEEEIQNLILDLNRDYSDFEKQGARPKTRSVPQLYHADELGALQIQTVTCEPVIISTKQEMKSAEDEETDDEYDYHGDLKAYCVSYKMPDQESPEGITIKQDQLISEMKPKTPSDEDEDDGDDDAGVYLEAHTYTESDTLVNGKDDAIIAIQGELLTDSSKSMSGSDEDNCKISRGSGNMEPLIITMATEIETDSKHCD